MAKLVVLLVGLAMFAAVAVLVWYLANRFERAEDRQAVRVSQWRPAELEEPDGVHVVVQHVVVAEPGEVLETRAVGVVSAADPDRADRLADLRTLAQDRARTLNEQAARA